MSAQKIYVIAPVLNEAENLPALFSTWNALAEGFPAWEFHFLLVDDGSTDGTEERARAENRGLALEILRHENNGGPGAAFATAFTSLDGRLHAEDIVVTMEGDNTSRESTLRIMLGRLEREGVDVALASPYAYGGGIANTNFLRVFLSHVANGLVKSFLGIRGIHTMSSFFRAYRGGTILRLQERFGPGILECSGFECMVELLKKIILLGDSITEVPMALDTGLRHGKSKMPVGKTIRGYLVVLWIAGSWS